jgi:PAS domain S-box-containing protein
LGESVNSITKVIVSAADLVRGFPQWREQARHDPVVISNHGRETHVLLGVELWEQLQVAADPGKPRAAGDADQVFEFADWIDEAVILYDEHLTVLFANRVAHAICRRPAKSLEGRPLLDALPEINGSLLDVHVRRTLLSSEPSSADIPSPFHEGAWLRLQTFPLGKRNAVVFRDISEDVQRHRMADVKSAILQSMVLHGGIGYVRISVRGTIVAVEGSFADMLGLPAERLCGVALIDLMDKADRPELRTKIDQALSRGMGDRFAAGFLGNDGQVHSLAVAIVPLNGAYGGEGAICLFTPA